MKILILGGTSEIGRVVIPHLINEQHEVVFSFYKNKETARQLEELGAKGMQLDFASPWELKGEWDAIIYAAQIDFKRLLKTDFRAFKTAEETDSTLMRDLYTLRVEAPFKLIQQARRLLPRGGQLLFLNTLDGVKTQTTPVFYSQCQASLKGLVESSAHELGEAKILVNQVCLGIVEGKVTSELPRHLKDKYLKHNALGRFMKPAEVADLINGLLNYNTYMTGTSVVADGGL